MSLPVDGDGARARRRRWRGPAQLGHDVGDDHRVLLAIVFGVGEEERQEVVVAEIGDGPEEGA